jgi:hypothetical protein
MYWLRTGNPLDFIPWLVTALFWAVGGWLLATHAFNLEQKERPMTGLALGLIGYTWFANLLGHWLPADWAFISAGVCTLLLGLAFAWKGKRPLLDWRDLSSSWTQFVAFLIITFAFLQISKGLALFDEPKNLTIISRMAAGDIPPHFYLNADYYFRYHYGFQLFAASLMRIGGLLPWSAFDLGKSIAFALALILVSLLAQRHSGKQWAGPIAAFVIAFASGTRYLLLLVPQIKLALLDSTIHLLGTSQTGSPFSQALFQGWPLDGGPPTPIMFAYVNGIFPPLTMQHAGSSILSAVIIILLLLVFPRITHRLTWVLLGIVLAFWALVWESSYGLFAIGGAIALVVGGNMHTRETKPAGNWFVATIKSIVTYPGFLALALSVPLVLLQGGTLTEMLRQAVFGAADAGIGVEGAVSAGGFSLRWPPAVFSAHLGALNIFSPGELLVAICELGVVILLTPWITAWAWRQFKSGDWVTGAMLIGAWVGLIVPLFLSYQAERDISRFSAYAMFVWTVFLTLMIMEPTNEVKPVLQKIGAAALGMMIFGGVVVTGMIMTGVSQPQLGLDMNSLDSRILRDTWNRLPADSAVIDRIPWRASVLTGLPTHSSISGIERLDTWESLIANPSVETLSANGYRYVFVDEIWWNEMPPEARADLSRPCVVVVSEYDKASHGLIRRLLDISTCQP